MPQRCAVVMPDSTRPPGRGPTAATGSTSDVPSHRAGRCHP